MKKMMKTKYRKKKHNYGYSFIETCIAIAVFSLIFSLFSKFTCLIIKENIFISRRIKNEVVRIKTEFNIQKFICSCYIPFWCCDYSLIGDGNKLLWVVDGNLVNESNDFDCSFKLLNIEESIEQNFLCFDIVYEVNKEVYETKSQISYSYCK